MEEIIERLQILIEAKCGSRGVKAFAESIGIGQTTLNNYLLRKRELGLKAVEAVLNTYPDVSAEWLLRGQDMPKDEEKHLDVPVKTLPRIPVKASAGSLTTMVDGITEIQCEQFPVVHNFPKYDFTIHISGDSMVPYYISGDEVACLRITSATFIQWGRVHVLDTSQGIVIKRIYDNGDTIRCVSYNPDYPDFNVPKDEIFSYNLVVGTLRL